MCERNVVKISDFGMARKVIRGCIYHKQRNDPLPVKWLALECISCRKFSTQSDVWAFGVLLWEMFSLGAVPYADIQTYEELYRLLRDGYRMEKPLYADEKIYDIMLSCWFVNVDLRPLFDKLASTFNGMLPSELWNRYIVLNELYERSNHLREQPPEIECSLEVGSPAEVAPPIPTHHFE
ncbi:tyrosine-protein kinase SRK2 [Anopheles sinensis]|uniref:Tyrosine-protein kinase SRK2 n=1 Tax=Anopheles sinensis TaxID=74873 RepID=A0A084VG69_ANOSI|nr:tyrosine-protein kinase SRK2 [Anopheles sinensis]